MNNTLKITLIVIGVVVLVGGMFFAGSYFYGGWPAAGAWGMPMMRGYGWNNYQSGGGYGPMMGNQAYNYGPMMGNPGYNSGRRGPMMGGGAYGSAQNVQPLSVEDARAAAQKYLDNLSLKDLSLGEIMIFDNNAYVAVKENSSGLGAFELLVDPVTKVAYPEPGPDMMWNLKYGGLTHAGMMRGAWQNGSSLNVPDVSPTMTLNASQAVTAAQNYLDQAVPGTKAASDPTQFYGYYTLDFSKDGKVVGMLSVNGFSGAIFLHTWHGNFIQESQ